MEKLDAHEEARNLTDLLKRALPTADDLPTEGEIESGGQKKVDGCFTMVSGCVRRDH